MTSLTGVGRLVSAQVKRDKARLVTWLLILPFLNYLVVLAFNAMFGDDPAGLAARAAIMSTPTGVVFGGPGYGTEHYTVPAMVLNEMTLYYELALVIGVVLLAVRSTRGDEESGRYELIGAEATGRFAPLAATMAVMTGLTLGTGLLMALTSIAAGLDAASSFAMDMGVALCALAFAAVAVLAAQIASGARGAAGLAMAVLGAAFLLRAAGDMERVHGGVASWLSPLAWPQQTRAYTALRWWPLALELVVFVLAGGAALVCAARRDLGAGMLPGRLGRPGAGPGLRGPLTLTARLMRGSWIAWAGGAAVLGGSCGPIMGDMPGYLEDNPQMGEILGVAGGAGAQALTDAFVGVLVMYVAFMALWFAISTLARLRAGEAGGTVETLLATPVARSRLLAAAVGVGGLGGAAILAAGGFAMGATLPAAARSPGTSALAGGLAVAGDALAYVPALLATLGLAVAVHGLAPRLAALNWALLAYSVVAAMFGPTLGLPHWALKLSPLSATPRLPAASLEWGVRGVLAAVAALLGAAGFAAHRRRDIASP
jgi:ABC-2 type transport system permease protein